MTNITGNPNTAQQGNTELPPEGREEQVGSQGDGVKNTKQQQLPGEKTITDTVKVADGGKTAAADQTKTVDGSPPKLDPPGPSSGSPEETVNDIVDMALGEWVPKGERDAFYNGGTVEMPFFDAEGNVTIEEVSLTSLLGGNAEKAALFAFVNKHSYLKDSNGELVRDEYGNAIKMQPEEFLQFMADNPEILKEEVFEGKLAEEYVNDLTMHGALFLNQFLDVIMNFMIMVKNALRSLTMMSQGQLKQAYERRMDTMGDMMEKYEKLVEENKKAAEALKKAQEVQKKSNSKTFFIISIVLSVVMAIASVVLSAVTLGVASPLGAAMMAIAVTMATLAIADAALEGKIMGAAISAVANGLINGIAEIFEAMGVDENVAKIIATTLLIVVVVAIVICTILLGSSSGASWLTGIVSSIATKVGATVATETAKQIALVVTMVIVNLVLAFIPTFEVYATTMAEAAAAHSGGQVSPALKWVIMGLTLVLTFACMAGMLLNMNEVMKHAGQSAQRIADVTGDVTFEATTKIGKALQMIKSKLPSTNMNPEKMANAVLTTGEIMATGASVGQGVTSIVQGKLMIKQAQHLERLAEHKENIAEIEAEIQIIKDALLKMMGLDEQSLNEFMERLNEDIKHTSEVMPKFFKSLESMSGIFSALFG